MKGLDLGRYALCGCVAAAMLAGCGGTGVQLGHPGLPFAPSFRAAGPLPLTAPSSRGRRSWTSAGAKRIKKLMYVAGAFLNTVYVYDYEKRKLVGELTGFDQPNGECVDRKGNIWITSWQGTTTTEYAHGGTSPIATLTTTQTFQTACSIDPTTGNLAVGTFYGTLYVFKNARGTPATYSSQACPYLWGPGYDDKGNLFVEAEATGTSAVLICELPHRGKSLKVVPFNWTIHYGADVMWDGKYMTFADQSFGGSELQAGVYQAKLNASGDLTLVGSTKLADPCGNSDVIQPFIVGRTNTPENMKQGTAATGSNNSCLTNVDLWPYPSGGNPSYVITALDKVTMGTAVSIAPHH